MTRTLADGSVTARPGGGLRLAVRYWVISLTLVVGVICGALALLGSPTVATWIARRIATPCRSPSFRFSLLGSPGSSVATPCGSPRSLCLRRHTPVRARTDVGIAMGARELQRRASRRTLSCSSTK
jgi:hypothetical protein